MNRKLTTWPFFLLQIFASCSSARDAITPAQPLSADEILVSADETFALGFFSPAGSTGTYVGIWYNKIATKTVVWVANRHNPIASSNASLAITAKGILAITGHSSEIIWSSWLSAKTSSPIARLLDTGNFVLMDATDTSLGSFAWQSFDYPTDTMLPGMKLGYDLRLGLNRNLTAWKSEIDPSPSDNCVAMDIHGSPQLTVLYGSVKKWRSGPWTGFGFNGIPEMKTYPRSGFSFNFVNTEDEVYYTYNMTNRSVLTRLVANETGKIQRLVWLESSKTWSLFWSMPKSDCEYAKCGTYGVCDQNMSPICACLPGFEPRSRAKWNAGNWSDGCVRKHELDCSNGNDGFAQVSKAMLPDTSNVTVDMGLGIDACQAKCLMNCSCTGYASADVRGDGNGCIIWSSELVDFGQFQFFEDGGQSFYLRVSAKDTGKFFLLLFFPVCMLSTATSFQRTRILAAPSSS